MTKVIFETATFADAVKKANQVAPSKGMAFDKASGIVIDVDGSLDPGITMRATNLDVYYREWVDSVRIEGEPRTWRIPAALLATMVSSLPIGSGTEVKLEEVTKGINTHLVISSGRTKARFNLMATEYYPDWDVFDPDELMPVQDLGGRIALVEWAADSSLVPLNGLCFDGESIITTDKYRLARTTLKIPNMPSEQVLVPAGLLGSILKQTGEVRIGFTDHQVLIMPNDTTQLRVVRFEGEFPKVQRIMDLPYDTGVEVPKAPLMEILRRATAFAGADRFPTLRLFLGNEELAVVMDNTDVGALQDRIDVPGYCTHDRLEMKFTPRNLMEAIDKSPNDRLTIQYDPSNPGKIVHIDGGSGYESWVVPRKEGEVQSSSEKSA